MATVTGGEILAEALQREGVDVFFYLMGAPLLDAEAACLRRGIRGVDVRHEQAAAMMAHSYSRVARRPGVCMAASGPGTANLVAGVANAFVDRAPVVALGGSSPLSQLGMGAFQEVDQLAMMRPVTRWAQHAYAPERIPELLHTALRESMVGRPAPVYLDLPGDVLYRSVASESVTWYGGDDLRPVRPLGDPESIEAALSLLAGARRPVLLYGSGVLWSEAWEALRLWVEQTGIPFYATPQARGAIPEDHPLSLPSARATALRETDLILFIGTRLNYIVNFGHPPRIAGGARLVQIDAEAAELGRNRRPDVGIVGDCRAILEQLATGGAAQADPGRYAEWLAHLRGIEEEKRQAQEDRMANPATPVHPLRLCREVRDLLHRDDVLVVDGQEILNFGRQSIPCYAPGHRLNSGTFGTMGVGLPYGIGAKVAAPARRVVVLHGDGSFGINALELDTAVRHGLPVLVVISLNGGWTADPDRSKPGRDLGYVRFDLLAEALGCYAEHVTDPEGIRPALQRALREVDAGRPALVNVVTDWRARATTARFSHYET